MSRRSITWIVLAGAVLGAGYGAVSYYASPLLERELTRFLQQKGFANVALRLSHVGLSGTSFQDISLGAENPLRLKRLAVQYSLSDLRQKTVRRVEVEGVALDVYQLDGQWKLRGLEPLLTAKSEGNGKLPIPMTKAALQALPLQHFVAKDSSVSVAGEKLRATLPLAVEWDPAAEKMLRYSAPHWEIQAGKVAVRTGKVVLDAALDEAKAQWSGTWSADAITLEGAPLVLPQLHAEGTVQLTESTVEVQAKISDASGVHHAAVNYTQTFTAPARAKLTVSDAALPWNGGALRIRKATIPISPAADVQLVLAAENISVTALMDAFTKDHAKGTGKISGVVPVTIRKNGDVVVHQGMLAASEPGTLSLTPETIPGDNAQLAQVRDILKNLHYTTLSMTANSEKDNAVSLQLIIEGRNPELPGSRPVRLNVHLSGDVLDLIQQNVMAVTAPNQLLEKHLDETK